MRSPGIYTDVHIDEYHAEEGISNSGINLILDCPARYYYEYFQKPKEEDKQAYKMGRALHMLVLEPDRFNAEFYCMTQDVDLRTKAGKEAYMQAEQVANGRTILRNGECKAILEMGESMSKHKTWKTVGDGLVEQSIYWDTDVYNTRLRSRPDFYNDTYIVDIKTTKSIADFKRSAFAYGYHRQAALQIDGLKYFNKAGDSHERFFAFFVVENKAPYLTAFFTLDKAAIDLGRREYKDAVAIYSDCVRYDLWEGYSEDVQLIELPKYLNKDENFE